MTDSKGPSRRALLGGLAAAGLAATIAPRKAEAGLTAIGYSGPSIPLWPGKAPGAPATLPVRKVKQNSTSPAFDDRLITGVANPSLEVRQPAYRDGSAVMLIPGGGYGFLAWDNEGEEQARWLTERGVTCFILAYRLPCEGWANRATVPLQDAQRAMRLIRARAGDFGIDPKRIGVLGFSAGGHLAGSIATRFDEKVYDSIDAADTLSARPDLAGMIYPVVNLSRSITHAGSRDNLLGKDASETLRVAGSVETRVTDQTPPVFLTASSDDGLVPIANSLAMYNAMLAKQRPVEFHGFDKGGHGFGVRLPDDVPAHVWPDLFHAYGKRHGVFTA
ncbi:alpha/beta hydrolase [Novosphingobium beihaiensis]|uniref:Alpha/beta hydrolase n=1 Tax=Novosphingobium beihaiensis TaxID=2930389 RepID=A0ABT0BQ79_9SPHN|nr:alpha/beta hydrolase [Novosphingobium beihaiensis]MCJ2187204.1 alpha/beta hydrolase [Novosphingobium beihaiensis]